MFAVVALLAGGIAFHSTGTPETQTQPGAVSTAASPLTSVSLCHSDSWRIADHALASSFVLPDC